MDILFKGWLEVRNAKMPIWRRRFCELRLAAGAEMRCYSSETADTADTADDSRRVKSIYFIESLQDWNGQGRVFSYDEARALAIRTRDGKVIQVVCPSGHAREQWKAQIARALPTVEGALAAAQVEEPAAALAQPDHVSIEHFSLLKVLGRGSFGKVMLVRCCSQALRGSYGKLFAMKSLQKRKIFKLKQFEHVLTERSVALNIQHPFLVNLCYAFQTAEKLYLVLEFMGGGDVFHWLQEAGTFSASRVRLYAAEIILGLGELHSKDIIFRDLKPENLMLDLEGHIHITDFGLAKANVSGIGEEGGARTLCGSPEYVAPEILRGRRHGKAVDWWSLGCVLYEMLYGTPPFYSTNKRQMFEQTLRAPVRLPASAPESTRSLILGLLQRDVAKRLGSGETAGLAAQGGGDAAATRVPGDEVSMGDAQQLQAHRYFSNVDWDRVLQRGYSPEFKPPAPTSLGETNNFDTVFTNELAQDSAVQPGSYLGSSGGGGQSFAGFSFDGGGGAFQS